MYFWKTGLHDCVRQKSIAKGKIWETYQRHNHPPYLRGGPGKELKTIQSLKKQSGIEESIRNEGNRNNPPVYKKMAPAQNRDHFKTIYRTTISSSATSITTSVTSSSSNNTSAILSSTCS